MPRACCTDEPSSELIKGLEQFNRGEYFEQHETLELLWRGEHGHLRDLYKGILQVGVGLYHLKRHNYTGAVHLLERGLSRLPNFAPHCLGIDIARLIAEAQLCYELVLSLGPERVSAFDWNLAPRIHVTQSPKRDSGSRQNTQPV